MMLIKRKGAKKRSLASKIIWGLILFSVLHFTVLTVILEVDE
jgi:hypothetical protein